MINNITDLNRFVSHHGIKPDMIVPKLAESKEIVSVNIARLLVKPSKHTLRQKSA